MESLPNNNASSHGGSHSHLKRKPRTTSVRVPSVNVISEVGDGQMMIRSQSVGHNIDTDTTTHFYDSNKLLSVNYNCNGRPNENGKTVPSNGKTDGMRYTLSQPLLINSTSEHENKPLKDAHKHWRSGTLSRPDIFYQVSNKSQNENEFAIKIQSRCCEEEGEEQKSAQDWRAVIVLDGRF